MIYDLVFKPALSQLRSVKKSATAAAKSVPLKKSSSSAAAANETD
jgi:hypothetical protein